MKLTQQQITFLSTLVTDANQRDSLGCDGCSELMAQFAESKAVEVETSPLLEAVRIHLEQCRCCRYEYEVFLIAMEEINVV